MELNKKQKEMIMDAHLLDKLVKDPDLIKQKLVDKQGRITLKGETVARSIAADKHQKAWR